MLVSLPNRPLPAPTDPLSETLHLLRMTGTLYCAAELSAPWGIDIPALEGSMTFQIVTSGSCWLEFEGAEPLFDIPVEQVSDRYEIMRYGGGGEVTHATHGVVRFDHVAAHRLIAMLPQVLQVDTWDDDDSIWMQSTLQFISREARAVRPGGETVITRLADILVIQAIRSWLASAPEAHQGWLAALRDEQIGGALAAIHRSPERNWSVATLATEVGMSRSAFSARFTEQVGESAMSYLTDWRMQLARTHLQDTSEPLSLVAGRFGYQSEAAFCRAFKRQFGAPPGSLRHSDRLNRLNAGGPLPDLAPSR